MIGPSASKCGNAPTTPRKSGYTRLIRLANPRGLASATALSARCTNDATHSIVLREGARTERGIRALCAKYSPLIGVHLYPQSVPAHDGAPVLARQRQRPRRSGATAG